MNNWALHMRSCFIILIAILSGQICIAQSLIQKNETLIFSFTTVNKKEVVLLKDAVSKKVFYRFGSKNKVEFQFPSAKKDSAQKMIYSFYLRGGGVSNEGMDLNYVNFTNNDFQYIIYDTYYAVGNKQKIGVRVVDLKTKKVKDIIGDVKTRKGTLTDFRDDHLLEIGEDIFD